MPKDPEAERQSAAELITLLLQERLRRQAEGRLSSVNERHIYLLFSGQLLWRHSEAEGKTTGCRYWSDGALQSREQYGTKASERKVAREDALQHDHLFPRKQLIAKLFSLGGPTVAEVRETLDRFNIGVVVTVKEHERLGDGVESDPWERYRVAGIQWQEYCDRSPE